MRVQSLARIGGRVWRRSDANMQMWNLWSPPTVWAKITTVETYIDDDRGYLAWLDAHPNGYVLNTHRNPQPSYLRLHRADCVSISGQPANGARWTATYVKRCGSRAELSAFAATVGGEVWECPTCLG